MRQEGFPNALHWALYAHDLAVESMRPINAGAGCRLDLDPESVVKIAHDTILTRSPWFSLSKWIWHIRKPAHGWPKVFSFSLAPKAYTFRAELWEMPAALHACIVLPCPDCDQEHPLSIMGEQADIAHACARLACPYTSRPLWPWHSVSDTEYAPVDNMLQFPTPTKKG